MGDLNKTAEVETGDVDSSDRGLTRALLLFTEKVGDCTVTILGRLLSSYEPLDGEIIVSGPR